MPEIGPHGNRSLTTYAYDKYKSVLTLKCKYLCKINGGFPHKHASNADRYSVDFISSYCFFFHLRVLVVFSHPHVQVFVHYRWAIPV